ncbi:MAG TPA: Smr/MutS family protein [Blastocatellia bacterium]|jgi:DNA mismatch repair protein MutS2|nr:Smr/MutS family protein [Blastocatellia bacterium]
MDERTYKTLELDSLVNLLARHVQTPIGRKRAVALLPSTNRDYINRELDVTTECADYLATGGAFGLADVSDPEASLAELHVVGTSLDPHQILSLQSLTATGMDVRGQFNDPEVRNRYPELARISARIPDLRRMLASIRGKILPTGEIDDNASPELRRIRREINERRSRIYRNLESLMRDRAPSAIQEDIVTIRNGRFVIPVRTDSRGQVPGVMHGLSSSGQTTFVEPLTIIDQNNELVRLREQEEIEIGQILLSISETLRANLAGINEVVQAIAEVDFAQAKARLSAEFKCVRPQMVDGRHLLLESARHPLLEHMLRQSGGAVVPISLEMDESHQTMVISGPNAGGKTVVLKTVGLISLMAQMGLHVPAREATLPVFHQALADIGDQQSIAANLSTFTAHMRNIAEMASSVAPPALILIDEVGTGTDPDEGAALGVAIVDFFHRTRATTIATTHYNPLKTWASQEEGVLNASVEFDEQTLRPTYRMIVGVAGASSGIEIARRMDVPVEIIDEAITLLDPAHTQASDYLKQLKLLVDEQQAMRAALEEERQATAEKFAGLDLEFARREVERRNEFESQLAQVIREFNAESARLLDSLKDRVAAARLKKDAESRAAELRRSAGARLRKQEATAPPASNAIPAAASGAEPGKLAAPAEPAGALIEEAAEIHERDRVRIKSLNQEGTVESISDDTYTVLVGSLRFRAKRDELQLIKAAAPQASKRAAALPRGVSASVDLDKNFSSEINVIGSNVDEATDQVDKFLDEAYLAGAESVRIVHGLGKGTLRRAIKELLTGHPHVDRFNQAPPNQGGAGATVVELRK